MIVKNIDEGRPVWYVCPNCNRILTLGERCPDCKKEGVYV